MYLEKVQAEERLREYEKEMELQELSVRTIHKYLTDIRQWLEKVEETVITKEMIVSYKKELKKKYKAASVNSKIISKKSHLDNSASMEENIFGKNLEKLLHFAVSTVLLV